MHDVNHFLELFLKTIFSATINGRIRNQGIYLDPDRPKLFGFESIRKCNPLHLVISVHKQINLISANC